MMKNIFYLLLGSALIIGCMCSTNAKIDKLKCSVSIDTIKDDIKNAFNADSVVIYTKRLREEIYFPELRCPVVLIYNATAKTLDFKKLPTDKYKGFESFLEINEQITKEALPVARELFQKCDMTEYNDLIIEFLKKGDDGKPLYRFICHYKELFD